jgi:quinol monooxygenase YgiN
MAFARLATVRFKPGKREEGLRVISRFKEEAERTEGFLDLLYLLSEDEPDVARLISVWDSEATMHSSEKGVFRSAMEMTEDLRDGPFEVKNHRVSDMGTEAWLVPALKAYREPH